MTLLNFLLCLTGAFLIGGIPFGYLTGRLVLRDDIRRHGSGNIGATNVGRVLGWKWGAGVLLLDALKGLLPTWGVQHFGPEFLSTEIAPHAAAACGLAAILGHMYPVYLKLRGGKGVATGLGVVMVLAPVQVGLAFLIFVVVTALTRIVSLASILAALCYAVSWFVMNGSAALEEQQWALSAFAIAVPGLIIWRHRSNLVRILQGTEPPFTRSARPETAKSETSEAEEEDPGVR